MTNSQYVVKPKEPTVLAGQSEYVLDGNDLMISTRVCSFQYCTLNYGHADRHVTPGGHCTRRPRAHRHCPIQ